MAWRRAASAAAVLLGLLTASCGAQAGGLAPPHPGLAGSVPVTLKVHRLPTTFGAAVNEQVPQSVRVTVPAAWRGGVWAYWSGMVLLGPAGWRGQGAWAADGSGSVAMWPPGGGPRRGPRVVLFTNGACVGCGASNAAEYFPYVRRHWADFAVVPGPAPRAAKLRSETFLAPGLALFQSPDASGGLAVDGVAASALAAGKRGISFATMRTYLPPSASALSALILSDFARRIGP